MPDDDPQALPSVLDRWLDQLGRGFEIEHLVDQGVFGGSHLIRLDEAIHALIGDDIAAARFRQLPIAVLGQLAAISHTDYTDCLLYTSPSPRDGLLSRMPSSA